jgi:5'-phosphate synthase pdxT subunit
LIVGVLAVQGDFAEHISTLSNIGVATREVRLPSDLDEIDAMIIPGGESTTLRKLFDLYNLTEFIIAKARNGTPIWGTCAGMIMLANELTDDRPEPLGLMDITVTRNAYGRQIDSFAAPVTCPLLGPEDFNGIFIRAPFVSKIGKEVEIIGQLNDGSPVALRQNNMLVTSFHPELTADARFHELFCQMVQPNKNRL